MTDQEISPFVKSFDWLEANLENENLRIIDASWFLPAQNRNAEQEYKTAHIPNAIFFDQDKIVDPDSTLPHALPKPDMFARKVGQMGIHQDHVIVVYDAIGMFCAPRVWWLFQTMGAKNTFVLNGGFDTWKAENRPVTSDIKNVEPTTFTPDFDQKSVAFIDDVKLALSDLNMQICDARGHGRFTGEDAEPRAGMRSGHMPSAQNIPFGILSENGKLKNINDLKEIFDSKIDLEKPIITTCGSGVTAAVLILALQSIGHNNHQLYDGSWSEWGARDDTDVVTGE